MADILVVSEQQVLIVEGVCPSVDVLEVAQSLEVVESGAQGPTGPRGAAGLTVLPMVAGDAVSGHSVLAMGADGRVAYADNNTPAHALAVVGVGLNAAVPDGAIDICASGPIEHTGWTFVPDQPVFLGVSGALTQSPSPGAFSLVMGVATSATRVFVRPQPPIFATQ